MKFTVTAEYDGTEIQQLHQWQGITADSKRRAIGLAESIPQKRKQK